MPDKVTVCGLLEALSLMVVVPLRVPSAVGVKDTEIVQEDLAPSVFGAMGQVELSEKSPAVTMLEMLSGTF